MMKPGVKTLYACYILAACTMMMLYACGDGHNAAQKKAEADSLMTYMRSNTNVQNIRENPNEVKRLLDSLQPVIIANGTYTAKCDYLRRVARYFANTNQPDSSRHYCDTALRLISQNGNGLKEIMQIKRVLVSCFQQENKPDSVLFYNKEAYAYAKKYNDTVMLPGVTEDLATAYGNIHDNEMNGKYLFEALAVTKGCDDRARICDYILGYYTEAGKYDSADIFFHTKIATDPALNNKTYENYGYVLLKKGKHEEALALYDNVRKKLIQTNQSLGGLYANIAKVYRWMGQYEKAERYYDSALANLEFNEPRVRINIIYQISRCAYGMKEYQRSCNLLDSTYWLRVKYFDSSFGAQNRELEIKYDVKLRDEEIKNLEIANTVTKKQAGLQRWLLIALGVSVLLGLVILFQYNRRRKLQLAKEKADTANEKVQLEQRLLRTQMEPHFIFNTLAQLQSQIRNHENDKAEEYLSRFAQLLRSSLENSRESFVQLSEEVAALENYLSLQALRFEGAFDYAMHLYDGYEHDLIAIPPMLLQPFVENAIQHGMRSLQHKGQIDIYIRKNNGMLLCTITDNGIGITATAPAKGQKGSLSTRITRERLDMLKKATGLPASLTIYSKEAPATGTVVEMAIPYMTLD